MAPAASQCVCCVERMGLLHRTVFPAAFPGKLLVQRLMLHRRICCLSSAPELGDGQYSCVGLCSMREVQATAPMLLVTLLLARMVE